MKLTCFVACAFGKKDVDKFYSKILYPLLRSMDIVLLRVDKINHNGNIDQKIISLIKNCDFGIADLSYARPSVYYEAGYLHGLKKDVVFTARRDHFSPKIEDEHGIFKIHFDLLTKNIIAWNKFDSALKKKIKNRVELISKPIIEEKNKFLKESKEREAFLRTSISDRIKLLAGYWTTIKSRSKYSRVDSSKKYQVYHSKSKKSVIVCIFDDKFSAANIKYFGRYKHAGWFTFQSYFSLNDIKSITFVFNSLKKVNDSSIHSALPDFEREEKRKIYNHIGDDKIKYKYIFIDGIESLKLYEAKLSSISF